MTLLTPIGLLGLLGILVLILIYILKPNYQQKFISSTFVWKLSLKYKKKKIPISKLRNILLIVCQVLILTACAMILTQPNLVLKESVSGREIVAIIDSSVSMRTQDAEYVDDVEDVSELPSRFNRAVDQVIALADSVLAEGGYITVILAKETPVILTERATQEEADEIYDQLRDLKFTDACSFGNSDLDAAIAACENVIAENPNTKIQIYTDVNFDYVPKQIEVKDVKQADEWNVAILNAEAQYEENYYAFVVELASYGRVGKDVRVDISVNEANMDAEGMYQSFRFTLSGLNCENGESITCIFVPTSLYNPTIHDVAYDYVYQIPDNERVFSYKSVNVSLYLAERDSFSYDNSFDIYGGQKVPIKIQYSSSKPNGFVRGVLLALQSEFSKSWDIQITQLKSTQEPVYEGFDFYIFEHRVPVRIPVDGVVLLINPEGVLTPEFGIRVDTIYDLNKQSVPVEAVEEDAITDNVSVENITISRFVKMSPDDSYKVLMAYDSNPLLMVKNQPTEKVAVLGFSLHYSNLPLLKEFPIMMYNMFNCFFPAMVNGNAFEVNEQVELNASSTELRVSGIDTPFTEFPATLTLSHPGAYTLTQVMLSGNTIEEKIYVRIPITESNIWATEDKLIEPYKPLNTDDFLQDLLLWISAALVTLIFIEWWLQNHENM